MYMDSMRIAPDPLASSAHEGEMRVQLRMELSNWASPQHTLLVHTSPQCVKTFVFLPGEQAVRIPCSTKRLTSVEILCYNDGEELTDKQARHFVQDTRNCVVTAFTGSAVLASEQYKICTRLRKPEQTESLDFLFSCYAYERDAHVSSSCAIADLFKDMQNMLQYPVLTPSRPVSELSVQEAEVRLADCRENVHGMFDTFDSIFLDTVVRELGQADNAAAVKNSIDWTRSHTVAADAAVESLINSTKLLYTQLAQLSNTAVPAKWLADSAFDGTVRNLLATRQSLLQNVRGRRTALADVTRVRSDFLCLDAIDSVLRHICRHEDEQAAEHPLSASLALPCHRYWLEQMKANTHNSVQLSAETYLHASTILDACAAARACPRMLPHSSALVASGPAAALTYKLWQSMHLQGLGATHELPLAPCAHFMYKKCARIDYSRHPVLSAALSSSTLGDEQRRSLVLLTMLVSTDVEHRIIPPALCTRIMTLLHDATAVDSTEQGRQDASAFLTRLLAPPLHSLAASALGLGGQPDLSFVTAAGADLGQSITGYDMSEVTSFCLQQVTK